MKPRSLLFLISFWLAAVLRAADYAPPTPSPNIAILRAAWDDAARDREVPVKIYYPAEGAGPLPVIIFSHGLGGNRDGYEYLGRHWAGCGYVSVHLQHLGSDDAVWRGADGMAGLRKSVADPLNAINRVSDVRFGIDQVLALNDNPASPLHGRVDPARIGMSGHSFGAWTTLAVTGERLGPLGETLADGYELPL